MQIAEFTSQKFMEEFQTINKIKEARMEMRSEQMADKLHKLISLYTSILIQFMKENKILNDIFKDKLDKLIQEVDPTRKQIREINTSLKNYQRDPKFVLKEGSEAWRNLGAPNELQPYKNANQNYARLMTR